MPFKARRSRLLIVLSLTVLFIGTAGFMILEGLSLIDALYFTIVTVSTVGYGDINPTNIASKLFSIVLIVTGIGIFLTIVTDMAQLLSQQGQDKLRRRRLHMIVGVFFTEVGNQLLRLFTESDPHIEEIRQDCRVTEQWEKVDFTLLKNNLNNHRYEIRFETAGLDNLRDFLRESGDLLLRQLENPDLIEQESFTELLWAVVHLRDELLARKSLEDLPEADLAHLAGDTRRAYTHLVTQWSDYLEHLKVSYPYLFSLALRTNPFVRDASPIVD